MKSYPVVAAILCTVALSAACTDSATKAPTHKATESASHAAQTSVSDEEKKAADVEGYWTKERMESAKPAPMPEAISPDDAGQQSDSSVPSDEPPSHTPGQSPEKRGDGSIK